MIYWLFDFKVTYFGLVPHLVKRYGTPVTDIYTTLENPLSQPPTDNAPQQYTPQQYAQKYAPQQYAIQQYAPQPQQFQQAPRPPAGPMQQSQELQGVLHKD